MQRQWFHHLILGGLALAFVGCGPVEPPKPPPPPLFPPPVDAAVTLPTPPDVVDSATIVPPPIVPPPVEPPAVDSSVLVPKTPITPPKKKELDVPHAPPPNWIWLPVNDGNMVFLRRRFGCKGKITRALLKIACDGEADVFINGKPIVHVRDGSITLEVDRYLKEGTNAIGIAAQRKGGPGAVALWMNYLGMETANVLRTDISWQGKHIPEKGWAEPELVGRGWFQVSDLGAVGADARPVPKAMEALKLIPRVPPRPPRQAADASTLELPPDFHAETIYTIPKEQGSWIAICSENKGSFIAASHGGALFRLTPRRGRPSVVQELKTKLRGAQGLAYHAGALYVSVNNEASTGVYRLRDGDGDGQYEEETLLKTLDASGEHGSHGLIPSPDGKRIFLTVGNKGKLPTGFAKERISGSWFNDSLLGSIGGRQNPDLVAPGGFISSFDLEGKDWELHSVGFRNCYDLAFNKRGDLFAFDADAERDAGAPWYRPNRLVHVVSGSDFGWRPGVHKWPDYRPDTLPTLLESRRGSPGALFSGANAAFPPRYRDAIFLIDWGRGSVSAAWLTPDGASYTAKQEPFVQGLAFPVIDGTIAPDGSMLLVTGGRFLPSAVYRIRYTGPEQPADPPVIATPDADSAHTLRKSLEAYHGKVDPGAVEAAMAGIAHSDRFVRYAARLALEAQPLVLWRDQGLAATSPNAALTVALGVARRGGAKDLTPLLETLGRFKFADISVEQQFLLLRAYSLASLRLGPLNAEQRVAIRRVLNPHFPHADDRLDAELSSLLAHLEEPALISKILLLLGGEPTTALSTFNALSFQAVAEEYTDNSLDLRQVHYAGVLRRTNLRWTEDQRGRYFKWLHHAEARANGSIFTQAVQEIRRDATKVMGAVAEPYKDLPPVPYTGDQPPAPTALGPGRSWTSEDAVAVIGTGPISRDFDNAKAMFRAAQCARCHRIGNDGGASGPDLSTLAGRFSTQDILESIIHPSRVISDQFAYKRVTLTNDAIHYGRQVARDDTQLSLSSDPFDSTALIQIPIAEIAKEEPAEISPMPPALINILNPEELRDLMAYLLSGGLPNSDYFSKSKRSPGPPPPPGAEAFEVEPVEKPVPPAGDEVPEDPALPVLEDGAQPPAPAE